MKRSLLFTILLSICMVGFSQKDVTKFLGIPIDGYKANMKTKLISKGFTYNKAGDYFTGEFNGADVDIHLVTNNNKVYRVAIFDKDYISETDIKIRFNRLCNQFANNKKYVPMNFGFEPYILDDDVDISYEMSVNNKRFEAGYYQLPEKLDTIELQRNVKAKLLETYTQEQLDNPTEEEKATIMYSILSYTSDLWSKKVVWFMISEYYGQYYIIMYYDNEYNHSNGEDL